MLPTPSVDSLDRRTTMSPGRPEDAVSCYPRTRRETIPCGGPKSDTPRVSSPDWTRSDPIRDRDDSTSNAANDSVLKELSWPSPLTDAMGQHRVGHRKLVPRATVKSGRLYGAATIPVPGSE
jgi:hypothetical protein